MTRELSIFRFGCAWWINVSALGVLTFGPVLIVDPVGDCIVLEIGLGPWTVRAGVNR